MPAMTATARPTDDFDMAKLQKSLKQRQRHSIRIKPHVAKLTPAEIRSLNNSVLTSVAGSEQSSNVSSPARSRRSTNATPPTSPDDGHVHTSNRRSTSRSSVHDVPTPPHTPNGHRRLSQNSVHSHHHGHHGHGHHVQHSNGIIYAPRPKGQAQATFVMSNGPSSRPSSSGSSTYRGLPTYRGPEVTRTGSMNMLQRPSPMIVANPLSQFSRPRQSVFSASPERHRHSQDLGPDRTHSLTHPRANSVSNVSAPSSRPVSPPRVTDSPVSMMADDTEKFPIFDPNDPHNQPKDFSDEDDIQQDPIRTPSTDDQSRNTVEAQPVVAAPQTQELEMPESPKKDKQKRFTIGSALFGGEKHNASDEKSGKLKKARRRTVSFTKSSEPDAKGNEKHASLGSPDADTKPDVTKTEPADFVTHPAVRPLSVVIPDESKGKEKEVHSAPVYSRCACCGKVKKPSGFSSGLSPVIENEHLRTNFSFELDRASEPSTGRRVSDASRQKFTPIIPMPISETETRQASIEPYTASTTPVKEPASPPSDSSPASLSRSSPLATSPRRSKKHMDPPKFVRFASLHGRRAVDSVIIAEEDELEADEGTPLVRDYQEGGEMSGRPSQDHGYGDEVAKSQPIYDIGPPPPTQTTTERKVVFYSAPQSHRNSEDLQPPRPSIAGSDSDTFFTPLGSVTPVVENPLPPQFKSALLPSQAAGSHIPSFGTDSSFLDLPESNLNLDLKNFDFGTSNTDDATTAGTPPVNSGALDSKHPQEVLAA